MARIVNCIKYGIEAEGLDFPPYPGPLGKRIWESVSKAAWQEWLKHQTMLVNVTCCPGFVARSTTWPDHGFSTRSVPPTVEVISSFVT